MSEIGFYHLTRSTLEQALPKLLERVLQSGGRAVVVAGSAERVAALDALLWTYDPGSFLPHGSARDGNAAEQPVWLTAEDENPNEAGYLFLVDGATVADIGRFARGFELFDGRDGEAVAAARGRWRAYRDAGHTLTYWQQGESGGWSRQA